MHAPTPEEKAELALNSLDGLARADAPPGLEAKLLARFDAEFSRRVPKWCWAAAALLLAVNVAVTLGAVAPQPPAQEQVAAYYFPPSSIY